MSADLLLELPSKVVKVFALPQATGATFQKAAIVIVQADSVSVAHVSSLERDTLDSCTKFSFFLLL